MLFFFVLFLSFSIIYMKLEEILFSGLTGCRANSCRLTMDVQPGQVSKSDLQYLLFVHLVAQT